MNFNTGGGGQLSSHDLRGELSFYDEDAVHAAMTDPHQFRIDLNRIHVSKVITDQSTTSEFID